MSFKEFQNWKRSIEQGEQEERGIAEHKGEKNGEIIEV